MSEWRMREAIWTKSELDKEFASYIWNEYKSYDPEKAWLNSRQPALNYRGKLRIVVDFVRSIPSPETTRELDPRPRPWVVVLSDRERLTPRGLIDYEQMKRVSQITPLKSALGTRLLFDNYEDAYQRSRELSEYVAQKCQISHIDIFSKRSAKCRKCGYESFAELSGSYGDFNERGHAFTVRTAPLEPRDELIHVCQHNI
jgi:hypothetical protein